MADKDMYMEIHTGSVDSEADWVDAAIAGGRLVRAE